MISEGQTRIFINKQLEQVGWDLTDPNNVQIEEHITRTGFADYVLKNRQGHPIGVVEAKRKGKDPRLADSQAREYAKSLKVPFLFLSNGDKNYFWEFDKESYPSKVSTFFSQKELEVRAASYFLRKPINSVPIDEKIVERDYSQNCIKILSDQIEKGENKLLVEMATGTGKTRLAVALIKRLFKASRINKVLFICDRTNLVTQAEDAFTEFLPDYSTYILRSGKFKHENHVTISTLQTIIGSYDIVNSGYYDLIVIDECHRSIYGQYRRALDYFHAIKIGLTATPCISDGVTSEDKLYVRDTLRFFELTKPNFSYNMRAAIKEGFLVPYYIYQARTMRTANIEEGITINKNEIDWTILNEEDRKLINKQFDNKEVATIPHSWLERKLTIPKRNQSIVKEFKEVLNNGFIDKNGIKHYPTEGKTIVFAVSQSHAVTLAKMFDQEFRDKKKSPEIRYADYVVCIQGEDSSAETKGKIKKFKDEEFPKILVSVDMLDTGFDCPEVTNLIHARFTYSNIKYRQMRGRGTRKADHIKKKCFWMFDFVGVTEFHVEEDPTVGPITKPGTGKPPKPVPRNLIELDVDDWIEPGSRSIVTFDDDGNIKRSSQEEEASSKVGFRFEGWLGKQTKLTGEQERHLRILGQQIKANIMEIKFLDDSFFAHKPFRGPDELKNIFGGETNYKKLINDINNNVINN